MNVNVELAVCIVKACCILHNFIRIRDGFNFENTLSIDGLENVNEINVLNDLTRRGNTIRDKFANYLLSDARKLEWQDKCI